MQRWVECDTLSYQDKKDSLHKQTLMLLLKCLKIMENATFLSTDNQVSLMILVARFMSHDNILDILTLISCYQVAIHTIKYLR